MSKMSKEEWSAQVPKEFVDKIPDDWHEKKIPGLENLYQEITLQHFTAEKQYQAGIKQKTAELQEHIKVTPQGQKVSEESSQATDLSQLQNQIEGIKEQKTAALKEAESNSAKLQEVQQSNNQLDQKTEAEKVVIENTQKLHLMQEEQGQNTQNEAGAALIGAENEA